MELAVTTIIVMVSLTVGIIICCAIGIIVGAIAFKCVNWVTDELGIEAEVKYQKKDETQKAKKGKDK